VTPDLVAPFAGLNVAVFPDNDWEGRSHAGDVARTLMDVAESVRVVQLEGRKEGEGVSEWIEWKKNEGLSDEEIAEILARAIDNAPLLDESSSLLRTGEFGRGGPFWHVGSGSQKIRVDGLKLAEFLSDRGFLRSKGASDESQLVHVQNSVVSAINHDYIRDHVVAYLNEEVPGGKDVIRVLMDKDGDYFSDKLTNYLPLLERDFHEDTRKKSYFFFQNGVAEVTRHGYRLRPHSEFDDLVWEEKIIDHEFEPLDFKGKPDESEYAKFAWNAMGKVKGRYLHLRGHLGYLQLSYKDRTAAFVPVFMDEDKSGCANGRTGKSLMARGLKYTCARKRYEARGYNFNRFAFQDLEGGKEIVYYDDAGPDFPSEKLFSITTGGMQAEAKNQDRVTISFEESPKFLLSTNYALKGIGESYKDRFRPIEFSDHYGRSHRPEDDFGHPFYEEGWDDEEWNRFYNTMVAFTQAYLRDGIPEYEPINVKYKQLAGMTCTDFAEWATDFIEPEVRYFTALDKFEAEYPTQKGTDPGKFGRWLGRYGSIYGLEKDKKRETRTEANGEKRRWYTIFHELN
jgi:hypothetical protein